jgi:hypothetical protein
VSLTGISYRDLWDYWETLGDPIIAKHTTLLRARYDVSLA